MEPIKVITTSRSLDISSRTVQRIRKMELIRAYHVINNKGQELIDCRLYMGRSNNASVVYCLAWLHLRDAWITCKGEAGGYGYNKQSEAVYLALASAGIEFNHPWGGTGLQKEGLMAVVDHIFPGEKYLVESYA